MEIAGIAPAPNGRGLHQGARNLIDACCGALRGNRYRIHDRDPRQPQHAYLGRTGRLDRSGHLLAREWDRFAGGGNVPSASNEWAPYHWVPGWPVQPPAVCQWRDHRCDTRHSWSFDHGADFEGLPARRPWHLPDAGSCAPLARENFDGHVNRRLSNQCRSVQPLRESRSWAIRNMQEVHHRHDSNDPARSTAGRRPRPPPPRDGRSQLLSGVFSPFRFRCHLA